MNQQQIKYARERLQTIHRERKGNRYSWGYTAEERQKLFEEGKYKVVHLNGNYTIVWDGEEGVRTQREAETAHLETTYRKALDAVMLGDEAEVLDIITKFANGDYN